MNNVADITAERIRSQIDRQMQTNVSSGSPIDHPNHTVILHRGAPAALHQVAENIHDGRAKIGELMRSYKHSPNSAPAILAKYVVHRINNVDKYDSEHLAKELDNHFLKVHQKDDGAVKNGHLTAADLHIMLGKNPHLVRNMLKHKDMVQDLISRGCGLSTREVNGEKYVALHRSVFAPALHDHALVSFGEQERPAIGLQQMHQWVPVKDIWFSYGMAPRWVSGEFGPEGEYLVGNTGERFGAYKDDVNESRLSEVPGEYFSIDGKTEHGLMPELLSPILDDAKDADTAKLIPNHEWLVEFFANHPERMGQQTYEAIKLHYPYLAHEVMGGAGVPRQEAMENLLQQAAQGSIEDVTPLQNPNLTPGDLAQLIAASNLFVGIQGHDALNAILKHPNYDENVAALLLHKAQQVSDLLSEQGHDRPSMRVLADTVAAVLSSRHPHKLAQTELLEGLRKHSLWAQMAVLGIRNGNALNDEFGDRVIRAMIEARNAQPEAWNGIDFSAPVRVLPLSNTLLKELVDTNKLTEQKTASLVDSGAAVKLLKAIGSHNPYIDPSAAQILAKSPVALDAMIHRKEWLPVDAQIAFTKHPTVEWRALASRPDIAPEAVHSLLEQLRIMDPGENAITEAQQKYAEIMQPVLSALAINPHVPWQVLWGAVQAKHTAAPKIVAQLASKHPERYMPQFSAKIGSIFEAELLNAIVRKRLHERAEGAEEIVPPRMLSRAS